VELESIAITSARIVALPDEASASNLGDIKTGAHTDPVSKQIGSAPPIPPRANLKSMATAVQKCRACDLWKDSTQAVFGAGDRHAAVMLVGEQPGDREDLAGKPFVGPAGKLLDRALADAGIDRAEVYITNAVKHFKWERRGKIRLHKKPNGKEIAACRPWLDAEIVAIRPKVIVLMGATAAQGLLGRDFRVTQHRGEFMNSSTPYRHEVTATVHPSSILRAPDEETRHQEMRGLVKDLQAVANRLKEIGRVPPPVTKRRQPSLSDEHAG
jgi:uracil-DNA glycosylase family protein